eukprot:COSAG01_NODE_55476_length_324_cov_7.235556_1_plen_34_part_01
MSFAGRFLLRGTSRTLMVMRDRNAGDVRHAGWR